MTDGTGFSDESGRDEFVGNPLRQFVNQSRENALRGAQRPPRSPTDPTAPGNAGSVVILHRGQVGRTGIVSVTIGETITGVDPTGQTVTVSDLIGLEYLDRSSGGTNRVQRSHWLQFVWTGLQCTTPRSSFYAIGDIYVNTAPVPLTTNPGHPHWRVDTLPPPGLGTTRALIPWYDYPTQYGTRLLGGGLALRTPTSLKILDAPGPGAGTDTSAIIRGILADAQNQVRVRTHGTVTTAALVFHFDTYLVQRFSLAYHVAWSASFHVTGLDQPTARQSPRAYLLGSSAPISRLPIALYTALINEYPAYNLVAHVQH